jgi:choline kinase
MRAIILAAGRGLRLRATTELPKCLFAPCDGPALLDRYIAGLDVLGIPATVVAGYRVDRIDARLAELAPRHTPTVVINPEFERGSVLSLARGLEGVDEELLLMDGDVLFHPDLLPRIAGAPFPNALLVDEGTSFTGEEYMAGIDAARVTELRRSALAGHEVCGEWIGFAKLSVAAVDALRVATARQISAGATAIGYEDALASVLPDHEFTSVPTAGLPWIEIDFPEDARRAEAILSW